MLPEDFHLLDAVPTGIQILEAVGDDPAGLTLVWANREASRQAGFDVAVLAGRPHVEAFPGGSGWAAEMWEACVRQEARLLDMPYADDRIEGWWRARVTPLGARRVLAAYEDVSEERRRERELRISERLSRAIVDSLHEGILVVDLDARIIQVNRAAAALADVAVAEALGRRMWELPIRILRGDGRGLAPGDLPHARALRGEAVRSEVLRLVREDGTGLWIEVDCAPLTDAGGAVYGALSTYDDVTERVERERRMRHEAESDPLTGLANRRALERTLRTAIARAERRGRAVAVLALDLDGFKAVNDLHGHPAGDMTLREVATRLRGTVRERDLVSRLGGDEFVLVLPDLARPAAATGAARECEQRVAVALQRPVAVDGAEVHLQAAVGVAHFPDDGPDAATLLAHADRVMYASKAARDPDL